MQEICDNYDTQRQEKDAVADEVYFCEKQEIKQQSSFINAEGGFLYGNDDDTKNPGGTCRA